MAKGNKVTPSKFRSKSRRSQMMKNLSRARWNVLAAQSNIRNKSPSPPPLEQEPDLNYKSLKDLIKGKRIVNLSYVLEQYEKVIRHPLLCTMGRMDFIKESRSGMISNFHFYCSNCDKGFIISSDPKLTGEGDLNYNIVWASLSIGIGPSQCQELFGVIDVPFMHYNTFAKRTSAVKKSWEEHLIKITQDAGAEERAIAIKRGNVSSDGTPFITVIVDGGWSKRTYGHGYNSASGVGIIVGAESKKPLFLGVRNKVCSYCNFHKNGISKPHECAKNYTGSSTSMEQNIIVEGFSKSKEQHGVIYKYMIGDGDSSVYTRVIEKVDYGRQVVKIECANHMTRCVNDKLHKLSSNTSYSIDSRKLLTVKGKDGFPRLERLVKGVRMAVKNNKNDANKLREELRNAPFHVFGHHSSCSESFCTRKNSNETDYTSIVDSNFFAEIRKILEPMVSKADRLSYNQTTNHAERYMSLVAKCTGGKRINFTNRFSYTARSYAAAISYNSGPGWHLTTLPQANSAHFTQQVFQTKQKIYLRRKNKGVGYPRKINRTALGPDLDYGTNPALPDISFKDMEEKKIVFLEKLKDRVSTLEKLQVIELSTRGQHDNKLWREFRLDYLTASNFGRVVKKRPSTSSHNLVKNILYRKDIHTPAISYGRLNEKNAILKYEQLKNISVAACGLFVDKENPFLGASPDGLVGDDGIVEVKCLPSVTGKLVESTKTAMCFTIKNNLIRLKKNHNFFFQIQGQLNVTKREFCDFIIYCDNDFNVERIYRDEYFWNTIMLPKIKTFYFECILPEIIDPRVPRGMKIREKESSV